jgi:hypothetical protein
LITEQAMAASGTLEVSEPKNNGSARIFVTDLSGGITANVNIAGNWTATQKRDAIFNAIQAQAVANGWGIAKKGAAGITITNGPNDVSVINFNPRRRSTQSDAGCCRMELPQMDAAVHPFLASPPMLAPYQNFYLPLQRITWEFFRAG